MLLSSVVIVLREVLEAALLFSILIALAKQMSLGTYWLLISFAIGVTGAIIYAVNIVHVSQWFDYVGQEVTNAMIQIMIYCLLVIYMLMLAAFLQQKKISKPLFLFVMIGITSMAMVREGSEIILYFFSVTRNDSYYLSVLVGMIIGASIGVSIGLLFYYLLDSIGSYKSGLVALLLLLLVAAGMISQASLLLIQADWLPAQLPLWDSSALLSEQSVFGQLLYALIGYESTPTAIQMALYCLAFVLPLSLLIIFKAKGYPKNNTSASQTETVSGTM